MANYRTALPTLGEGIFVSYTGIETDLPTLLSAQVGPRDDGYAPTEQMTADEAETYHGEQIETISKTEADLVVPFPFATRKKPSVSFKPGCDLKFLL